MPRRNKLKRRADKSPKITAHKPNQLPPDRQPPLFSLQYLGGKYCLSKCELEEKAAFAETLRRLSLLTWAEIRQQGRHKLGHEKIARGSIKQSIPAGITDDVTFLAFRFHRNKPMVGYRDRRVFYILWIDRDFSLYDH